MLRSVLLLMAMVVFLYPSNAIAQTYLLNEDFSNASGTTPPTEWSNITFQGTATDLWRFDNPGNRSIVFPLVSKVAIFDSEKYSAGGGKEKVSLESPFVDCSFGPYVLLYFDHQFVEGRGGKGSLEAFNGDSWVTVKEFTASTVGVVTEFVDLSGLLGNRRSTKLRFTWEGDASNYWMIDNVKMISPQLRDAKLEFISNPRMVFTAGTYTVKAALKNEGYEKLSSAVIQWSVNGVMQTPVNWTGDLAFYQIDSNVALGNYDFPSGKILDFKVWVEKPNNKNDLNSLNDTLATQVVAALCGEFTIGGSNPDYPTFSDAAYALKLGGVSCAVVLKARDGTYNEQMTLEEIKGTSAVNTVTFTSESNDSSKVKLDFKATAALNDFTLRLSRSRYINFTYLTLDRSGGGRSVFVESGSGDINFRNCFIKGISLKGARNIEFTSNLIYTAYDWYALVIDQVFKLNIFNNIFYTIRGVTNTSESDTILIKHNRFETPSINSAGWAISLDRVKNVALIDSNSIYGYGDGGIACSPPAGSNWKVRWNLIRNTNLWGISTGGSGGEYSSNRILFARQGGIQVGATNSLVANNYIHVTGNPVSKGILLQTTGARSRILFNSVNIKGADAVNGRALEYIGGNDFEIRNNIFANNNGGYAAYFIPSTLPFTLTHNDFFSTRKRYLFFKGITYNRLDSFVRVSGHGQNSFTVDPYYLSDTVLLPAHYSLNETAIPIADITTDINGLTRNPKPDMGATEFNDFCLNDGGIEEFWEIDSVGPSGVTIIKIVLRNHGSGNITTADIGWRVNGIDQPNYRWAGLLPPGDTAIVSIGSYTFNPDSAYKISARLITVNGEIDCNPQNNGPGGECEIPISPKPLCGDYTIGGVNPDYSNFTDAVDDLHLRGVSCPVTFYVRDGVYEERIKIYEVKGSSEINTVTFIGENRDSSRAILQYRVINPSDNITLSIIGGTHLFFRHLGIKKIEGHGCVSVSEFARNINFENCNIANTLYANNSNSLRIEKSVISYFDAINCSVIRIRKSTIPLFHNYWGVHLVTCTNVLLDENLLLGNYGIYAEKSSDSVVVINNTLRNSYAAADRAAGVALENVLRVAHVEGNNLESQIDYGIYFNSPSAQTQSSIIRNTINNASGSGITFGGPEVRVLNNRITNHRNGNGIIFSSQGALVANNFIHVKGATLATGISIVGSPTAARVVFNSVNVTGTCQETSRAIEINDNPLQLYIKNNIFSNAGKGYAAYIKSSGSSVATWQLDNNDYYSARKFIGNFEGRNFDSIGTFRAATKKDLNSVSVNPFYTSDTVLDIHQKLLDNRGAIDTAVKSDIYENPRGTPPDIGAQEISLCNTDAGINGIVEMPRSIPVGLYPISVELQNHGTNALTGATIRWSVDGKEQQSIAWTGSLPSLARANVFLGQYNFTAGRIFKVKAWVELPQGEDCDPLNDACQSFETGTPLCGTYTIGGSDGDFATFNEAVDVLNTAGVTCPVTFKVRNGIYREQLKFYEIPGASAVNKVLFEGGEDTTLVGQRSLPPYLDEDLKKDLVCHFPLNGNTVDSSANNLINAAKDISFVRDRFGIYNGAGSFNGGSYIEVPANISEDSLTVSFYFRTVNQNAGLFAVTSASFGGGHDRHILLTNGNIYARLWNNEVIVSSGRFYADGDWHHVVYQYAKGRLGQRLIVDGEIVASGNKDYSDFNWQDRLYFGYSTDIGFMSGDMDDLSVWNRALTLSEINKLTSGIRVSIPRIVYDIKNSPTNFTIKMYNTGYVGFRKIGIRRTNAGAGSNNIYLEKGCSNILIDQCVLDNIYAESGRSIFLTNSVLGLNPNAWSSYFRSIKGLYITGNFINNNYGTYCNSGDSIFIKGNKFQSPASDRGNAIFVENTQNIVEVDSNDIYNYINFGIADYGRPNVNKHKVRYNYIRKIRDYGIAFDRNGGEFIGNRITGVYSGIGMYVRASNALVANNFIQTEGVGISKGIVVSPEAHGVKIVFNSVNVLGTDPLNGRAFEVEGTGPSSITVKNNIFSNKGLGFAAYANSLPLQRDWDYNSYFTKGQSFGLIGNKTYERLSDWAPAINGDANARYMDPKFATDTTALPYQKQLNGAGIASSGVLIDIGGELRNQQAPDIGAEEFLVDFGITRLISPTNECTHTSQTPVTVFLRQFGDIPFIDLKLAYQVNGGTIYRDTIPGTITNDIEYTFKVPQDLSLTGEYAFKVWLVDNSDDNINNDTLIIIRKTKEAPVVDFNYTTQCAGLAVPFSATASVAGGTIDRLEWNFGDSTFGSGYSPSHIYDTAGTYKVTVLAYSNEGCYTSLSKLVTLKPTPLVDFEATNVCEGNAVALQNFTRMAGGSGVLTVNWDFGDSTGSTEYSPVHLYKKPGSYTIQLTATGDNGCSDNEIKTVRIYPLIPVSFDIDTLFELNGAPYFLQGNPAGGRFSGPGVQRNTFTPLFAGVGLHSITYSLSNDTTGCESVLIKKVRVVKAPAIKKQPMPLRICQGGSAKLSVEADGSDLRYFWQKNGVVLAGKTSNEIIFTNSAISDSGYYQVFIYNEWDTVASSFVRVEIDKPLDTLIKVLICDGRSYTLPDGRVVSVSGMYTSSFKTGGGCDSIIYTDLRISMPTTASVQGSICTGGVFNYNGKQYNAVGVYKDTLVNATGCDSIVTITVTLSSGPDPSLPSPVVDGTFERCGPGTINLTVSITGGYLVDWYAASSGGSILPNGSATTLFITPSLTGSATYYAQTRNSISQCVSVSRTPVQAVIVPPSVAGTVTGNATVCSGVNNTRLQVTGSVGSIQWQRSKDNVTYQDITGAVGNTHNVLNIDTSTYYRVTVKNGICPPVYSAPVRMNVIQRPATPVLGGVYQCGNGVLVFYAFSPTGSVIDWYSVPVGGSILPSGKSTNKFHLTPSTNLTAVYAEARDLATGCKSARLPIIVANIDPQSIKPCPAKDLRPPTVFYPNPATNTITMNVGMESRTGYKISIFNSKGIKVLESFSRASVFTLDVSRLSAGLYAIEVEDDMRVFMHKFIKI